MWVDPEFDFGFMFGYKKQKWSILKSNYVDMNMVDLVTVSTEPLKKYVQELTGVKTPIEVVSNTVPQFLYGKARRAGVKRRIEKPIIVYPQSPTHYSNSKKMKGDLNNSWYDYFMKSIEENKIQMVTMGNLPWMFEDVKDKIKVIPWINAYQYAAILKAMSPHFVIMPLVPNDFNSAKSDIKYIETCAVGAIGIGTKFKSGRISPYDNNIVTLPDDCTIKDIEETIYKYCDSKEYNEVITKQYDMLDTDGRYLESPQFINKLISIL